MDCSQDTAALVDKEVQQLLRQCHERAMQILRDNRSLLDEIAEYLLAKETITGEELMAFVNADAQKPVEE